MSKTIQSFEGILLFVAALLLFACMDSTTKYLAAAYNVPLIVAIRYITHFLLMVMLLAPRHGRKLIRTQRTGLVMLRAAALATSSLLMGMALQRMPLAETTAIVFLGPMLVVLLAVPLLGERISKVSWIAAVLGFIGLLLIARPGTGLGLTGMLFAFGVVCALVAYQLLSRVLASTEETMALLFYTALIGAVVYGCMLPWTWHGPAPSTLDVLLFLSMGVSGGLGHYLYTAAYRHASASLLAPMNYLQLLWAGLLGWAVFAHVPDTWSIMGMIIIILSGAIIALQTRPVKKPEIVGENVH